VNADCCRLRNFPDWKRCVESPNAGHAQALAARKMDLLMIDVDDISFEPGFQWSGMFVKRAMRRGRPLSFRFSTHLIVNCLEPASGQPGPAATIEAYEQAIETACRKAAQRGNAAASTIDLRRDDFDEAA
jgi:hypothetical protein